MNQYLVLLTTASLRTPDIYIYHPASRVAQVARKLGNQEALAQAARSNWPHPIPRRPNLTYPYPAATQSVPNDVGRDERTARALHPVEMLVDVPDGSTSA